ncbi:MAG: hypothetical protein RBS80_16605 [Thermoguttaceae bacterium]|jgi:hypothetical protein|nr:hypothetical protein [Thermoguttaceae bacterium]
MQRMIFLALAICAIAFATATAWAEGPKEGRARPQPPQGAFDPARLFDRLAGDKEGVISLDKLPERLPGQLREVLTKADADGDGKVTREEFQAAAKAAREQFAERRTEATAKERPTRPRRPDVTRDRSRRGPQTEGTGRPRRASSPHPAPARQPMPDLKALFARMDRDKSGELSLEEFTAGMRRLREHIARWQAPVRPPMGPQARRPMGPHMRPPMGRPDGRPGPSWHRKPAGPPRGPAARPAEAKPHERPGPPRGPREGRPEARPERPRGPREGQPAVRPGPPRRPEGDRPEARPERPRRPEGDRPEARPERPRRPEGDRPEARPERPRRPEGDRPEARPEPPRRPRGARPESDKPAEKPADKT